MHTAVETNSLSKVYKSNTEYKALDSLSICVPRGCIFGLLGPNGAGKSTFINILAGLTIKTSGSVHVCGINQDELPMKTRSLLGVMLQETTIDPFLSPRESLHIQAGLYGIPPEKRNVDETLDKLELLDKADAYTRTLSGGMKRRLMLAKAIIHKPELLILDEPSAGVDIALRKKLWSFVKELNNNGTTIILTTHYLEEAQDMCEHIAIINKGQLTTCQPTSQLMRSLNINYLVVKPKKLETDIPKSLSDNLDLDVSITKNKDLRIAYNTTKVNPVEVLNILQQAQIEIQDFRTEDPKLEDIFLHLTENA